MDSLLAEILRKGQARTVDQIIFALNPKMTGWTHYFNKVNSAATFHRLDHLLWWKILRWAKRRHANKSAKWVVAKYFQPRGGRKYNVIGEKRTLRWHVKTPIERHRTRLLQHLKTSRMRGFLSGRGNTPPLPWLGTPKPGSSMTGESRLAGLQ